VLVHAGDFTYRGKENEISSFIRWFTALPHTYKILIAGNHEVLLDPDTPMNRRPDKHEMAAKLRAHLTDCQPGRVFYLHDSSVHVCGLTFYGSPWQPTFGGWAFNAERGSEIREKWDLIHAGVDVLVTHGPPKGHGDRVTSGHEVGCEDLREACETRVRPMVHVFGHIHEAYGVSANAHTLFVNASTCTVRYRPDNPAVVIDVRLPDVVGVDV